MDFRANLRPDSFPTWRKGKVCLLTWWSYMEWLRILSRMTFCAFVRPNRSHGISKRKLSRCLTHSHYRATETHSTRNLPLLLAGGGFRHGESKIYPEEDPRRVPASNLLLSMLQNFGVEADRFGPSTGTLTGFERKS